MKPKGVEVMSIHDWTRVHAGIFHDFHHEWISTIKRALNSGLLPSEFYALAEQVAGGLHPDVLALEHGASNPSSRGRNGSTSQGPSAPEIGVAVATLPPRVR